MIPGHKKGMIQTDVIGRNSAIKPKKFIDFHEMLDEIDLFIFTFDH